MQRMLPGTYIYTNQPPKCASLSVNKPFVFPLPLHALETININTYNKKLKRIDTCFYTNLETPPL